MLKTVKCNFKLNIKSYVSWFLLPYEGKFDFTTDIKHNVHIGFPIKICIFNHKNNKVTFLCPSAELP